MYVGATCHPYVTKSDRPSIVCWSRTATLIAYITCVRTFISRTCACMHTYIQARGSNIHTSIQRRTFIIQIRNSSTHFADHHILPHFIQQSIACHSLSGVAERLQHTTVYDPIRIMISLPKTYAISHAPLLPQYPSDKQAYQSPCMLRPQKLHHHISRLSTMVAP